METKKPTGIIVSVGYGPYLRLTLPFSARHLDRIFVLTTPTDEETKTVCSQYPNVTVIETSLFYAFNAKFNKGAVIEVVLQMIPRDQWCLILDADICLPEKMFDLDSLNKNILYGARRFLVYTEDEFKRRTQDGNFDVRGLPTDGRDKAVGVIGMFQLFHPQAEALRGKGYWYGINSWDAAWGDMFFQYHWHPKCRCVMPLNVLHLGEVRNWSGKAKGLFERTNDLSGRKHCGKKKLGTSTKIILKRVLDEVVVHRGKCESQNKGVVVEKEGGSQDEAKQVVAGEVALVETAG